MAVNRRSEENIIDILRKRIMLVEKEKKDLTQSLSEATKKINELLQPQFRQNGMANKELNKFKEKKEDLERELAEVATREKELNREVIRIKKEKNEWENERKELIEMIQKMSDEKGEWENERKRYENEIENLKHRLTTNNPYFSVFIEQNSKTAEILKTDFCKKKTVKLVRRNKNVLKVTVVCTQVFNQVWKVTIKPPLPKTIKYFALHESKDESNKRFVVILRNDPNENEIIIYVDKPMKYDICGYGDSFENLTFNGIEIK